MNLFGADTRFGGRDFGPSSVDTDGDEVSWVEEAPQDLNFGRTWMLKISGVQIMEVLPRPGLGKRKE